MLDWIVNIKPWVLKNGEKLFFRAKITFRSTGTQNIFQKLITQQGIVEEEPLWSGRSSYLQENLIQLDWKVIKWSSFKIMFCWIVLGISRKLFPVLNK